jgi:hypothetical protein
MEIKGTITHFNTSQKDVKVPKWALLALRITAILFYANKLEKFGNLYKDMVD